MKRFLSLVAVLSLIVVFVAACGGGGGSSAGNGGSASGGATKTFDVKLQNMSFDPKDLTVNEGDHVVVNLTNPDSIVHSFVIKDFGVEATVDAGGSQKVEFDANKAGKYEIICVEPGHEAAGMTGTLTVQ